MVRRLARRALRPLLEHVRQIEERIGRLEGKTDAVAASIESIDERLFESARLATVVLERELRATIDEVRADAARHVNEAVEAAHESAVRIAQGHAEEGLSLLARDTIDVAARHAEAAAEAASRTAFAAAREHAEALGNQMREQSSEELATIRRAISRSRPRAEASADSAPPATADHEPPAGLEDAFYVALEDRFRGDPAVIRERQRVYVDIVRKHADPDHPVIDLGCGRGEWLALLGTEGVPARGVDSNRTCVDECVDAGLDVGLGDLVQTVRDAADGSAGAITLFQVVEHLPFAVLVDVLDECARVLVPGGVLLAETPNALNLRVAATTFWLDPTHVHPLHPELLRFLAEQVGFARCEDIFANDIGVAPDFSGLDAPAAAWLDSFAKSIEGPGDYALVAWMAAADHG